MSTGIGVSGYNARELSEAGFAHTAVAPLDDGAVQSSTAAPDPAAAAELARCEAAGGSDWLFVGQMLPHKCHQDVIKAFACSLRAFDPTARLHLVGRESCPAMCSRSAASSTTSASAALSTLPARSRQAELAAYYQAADVFVGCSAHEGFCAPMIEAMHHGVPVVAYAAAAVPETVLDAGLLLDSKEPLLVATAAEQGA